MFTGIIETQARLVAKENEGTNTHFWFSSSITHELKVDQSVAHNGVCLTVVELNADKYRVTAIEETLGRTNLVELELGDKVNLERCMPSHGRFDGHIVQGHVDDTAICNLVEDANGSWRFRFKLNDSKQQKLLVQKVLFVSMGLVSLLLIAKRIGLVWPLFLIPLSIQILIHSKWQPRSISNLIL